MTTLEDSQPNVAMRGILPDSMVTVVRGCGSARMLWH